ncbi:MAG: AGE family epimerase/isomerase, partial [Oricola sp.]|nr:AGE family epimerase/isomerase [Oricola sp.]
SPHGGWLESDRRETPRRQNPHMHLFEAFLALHRVTGREDFLARANALRVLFGRVFYDPDHGVVREFFDAEWNLKGDDQPVEPGHMLEWSWLLGAYERAGGEGGVEIRRKLYARARVLGLDPGFFGFYDNHSPLNGGAHGAKRLWPQTEGLRAALSLGHKEDAALLADNLFRTYLATEVAGLWIDEFDADGRPVAKDTPASIAYHLFEAVAEADAVLNAVSSSGEAG